MTKDDFQKKYHYYKTNSEEEANHEATKVNEEGIEGDKAVAVKFGNLGWALMLETAAKFIKEIGII